VLNTNQSPDPKVYLYDVRYCHHFVTFTNSHFNFLIKSLDQVNPNLVEMLPVWSSIFYRIFISVGGRAQVAQWVR